jgi:uncharacterized protein YeaO (DUF488 family)
MAIKVKRIYEAASRDDGIRILVDRLWPRGVSKEEAKLDGWLKEISPSTELRKWFNHDSSKFKQFKEKYKAELQDDKHLDAFKKLKNIVKDSEQQITLLFSAKNEKENQAIVLKEILDNQ